MSKIISFDDFSKSGQGIKEGSREIEGMEHSDEQYYMFFQNLASIKHYIDEIMKYDPADIDNLLRNGHDWASDHVATSKDDLGEVAEWIRNEMEGGEDDHQGVMAAEEEPEEEVEVEDEEEESNDNGEESEEDEDE